MKTDMMIDIGIHIADIIKQHNNDVPCLGLECRICGTEARWDIEEGETPTVIDGMMWIASCFDRGWGVSDMTRVLCPDCYDRANEEGKRR